MKPSFLKTFSFLSLLAILILTQGNTSKEPKEAHDICKITLCVVDCNNDPVTNLLVDIWDGPRDAFGSTYVGGIVTEEPLGCSEAGALNLSGDAVYYAYLGGNDPYQTFIACNNCGHCHEQTITLVYGNCDNNSNNSNNTSSPYEYSLKQNFPNPFNPNTTISFSIAKSGNVNLVVCDVLGKEVSVLVNEFKSAGGYDINFDASALSSGIYFYTLTSGDFTETKKMFLIK